MTLALLCYPVSALTVRQADGGWLLRAVPASLSNEFRITWIHTVSKRPVSEKYAIGDDGRFCLMEMAFDHEGPGLPSSPETGTAWRIEHGKVIVTGYSRCLERLHLGVSPFGHRLETGLWDWNLVTGIGADRLASVAVERIPLILIVWAEVRQWRHNTSKS